MHTRTANTHRVFNTVRTHALPADHALDRRREAGLEDILHCQTQACQSLLLGVLGHGERKRCPLLASTAYQGPRALPQMGWYSIQSATDVQCSMQAAALVSC